VVDFDKVWRWTGFSRKDNGKNVLNKHFVKDIDYKVDLKPEQNHENKNSAPEVAVRKFAPSGGAGLNKETILVSVNTFKKFCLKANTKKADEIHDYYIKLKDMFHEIVNEETDELRNQLLFQKEKNNDIEQQKAKIEKEKTKIEKEKDLYKKELNRVVYHRKSKLFKKGLAIYAGVNNVEHDVFKVGSTNNANSRQSCLGNGSTRDFDMTDIWYSKYYKVIEEAVKINFANVRVTNKKEFYNIKYKEDILGFITKCVEFFDLNKSEHETLTLKS